MTNTVTVCTKNPREELSLLQRISVCLFYPGLFKNALQLVVHCVCVSNWLTVAIFIFFFVIPVVGEATDDGERAA